MKNTYTINLLYFTLIIFGARSADLQLTNSTSQFEALPTELTKEIFKRVAILDHRAASLTCIKQEIKSINRARLVNKFFKTHVPLINLPTLLEQLPFFEIPYSTEEVEDYFYRSGPHYLDLDANPYYARKATQKARSRLQKYKQTLKRRGFRYDEEMNNKLITDLGPFLKENSNIKHFSYRARERKFKIHSPLFFAIYSPSILQFLLNQGIKPGFARNKRGHNELQKMEYLRHRYLQYTKENWQETEENAKLITKLKLFAALDQYKDSNNNSYPLFIHETINLLEQYNCCRRILPSELSLAENDRLPNNLEQYIKSFMIKGYDPYTLLPERATLLHYYIEHVFPLNIKLIRDMIEYGFDQNLATKFGETPLSLCLSLLHEKVRRNQNFIQSVCNIEKIIQLLTNSPAFDPVSIDYTHSIENSNYYSVDVMNKMQRMINRKCKIDEMFARNCWNKLIDTYNYKLRYTPHRDLESVHEYYFNAADSFLQKFPLQNTHNKGKLWKTVIKKIPDNRLYEWLNLLNEHNIPLGDTLLANVYEYQKHNKNIVALFTYFLEKGAFVNSYNGHRCEGYEGLLLNTLIFDKKKELIELLIRYGINPADPEFKDRHYGFPLSVALDKGDFDLVEKFLPLLKFDDKGIVIASIINTFISRYCRKGKNYRSAANSLDERIFNEEQYNNYKKAENILLKILDSYHPNTYERLSKHEIFSILLQNSSLQVIESLLNNCHLPQGESISIDATDLIDKVAPDKVALCLKYCKDDKPFKIIFKNSNLFKLLLINLFEKSYSNFSSSDCFKHNNTEIYCFLAQELLRSNAHNTKLLYDLFEYVTLHTQDRENSVQQWIFLLRENGLQIDDKILTIATNNKALHLLANTNKQQDASKSSQNIYQIPAIEIAPPLHVTLVDTDTLQDSARASANTRDSQEESKIKKRKKESKGKEQQSSLPVAKTATHTSSIFWFLPPWCTNTVNSIKTFYALLKIIYPFF